MWIGSSIVVMAVGAVMAFAVEKDVEWLDVDTAGWILVVVGAITLLWSLLVATQIGPWRRDDVV